MLERSTIVVLAAAAVGVAALIAVRYGPGAETQAAESTALLQADELPVDAVTRVELRRGDSRMVFERRQAGWMQTEPFAYPMDPFSMRQLAAQAAQLQITRRLEGDDVNLAELGLSPPRVELRYGWPGGAATLEFGRRAVAGRSYLRRKEDPSVYVVAGDLFQRAVEMDPREWRDRTLFQNVSVDADRIAIEDLDGRKTLRREGRIWIMDEPVATRLDQAVVGELISALARGQSGGFILDQPDDLTKFGLTSPAGTIEIVQGDEVQKLLVGARMAVGSEDHFGLLEGRPVVVRLPAAVLAAFFRPATDLIDATASGVLPADVKSIIIRSPEGEVELHRELERWVAAEGGAEVSQALVQDLLEKLTTRRAVAVEIRPYPQLMHAATVTLYGFGGRPLDSVRVAHEPQTGQWAMDNGDDVVRIFPPEVQPPLSRTDFGLTP